MARGFFIDKVENNRLNYLQILENLIKERIPMKPVKLAEITKKKYSRLGIEHGYAGQTLHIDISARQPDEKIWFEKVTEAMKDIIRLNL